MLIALVAGLPLAVLLLASPVTEVVRATYQDYLANSTPEARTVLTVDSVSVAGEHFPAGAGFGRFGSAAAAENYSPEYVARLPEHLGARPHGRGRQLPHRHRMARDPRRDGLLGAAAFACGLIAIYRAGRRLHRDGAGPLPRWSGLTLTGWVV